LHFALHTDQVLRLPYLTISLPSCLLTLQNLSLAARKSHQHIGTVALQTLLGDNTLPDTPAERYDDATEAYLRNLYAPERCSRSCEIENLEQLLEWQLDARHDLYRITGLWQMQDELADHTPTVKRSDVEDMGNYTRTRCSIEAEPGFDLPFWLLQPKSDGPHPLAILPHGHDPHGMDTGVGLAHDDGHAEKIASEDRDVAVQAVQRGYIAIAPSARGTSSVTGIPDVKGRHGRTRLGCDAANRLGT